MCVRVCLSVFCFYFRLGSIDAMHKYFRYIAVRSSRSVDLLLAIFIFICVHLVVYVQISGQHLTKCPFRACK